MIETEARTTLLEAAFAFAADTARMWFAGAEVGDDRVVIRLNHEELGLVPVRERASAIAGNSAGLATSLLDQARRLGVKSGDAFSLVLVIQFDPVAVTEMNRPLARITQVREGLF